MAEFIIRKTFYETISKMLHFYHISGLLLKVKKLGREFNLPAPGLLILFLYLVSFCRHTPTAMVDKEPSFVLFIHTVHRAKTVLAVKLMDQKFVPDISNEAIVCIT